MERGGPISGFRSAGPVGGCRQSDLVGGFRVSGLLWGCVARIEILTLFGIGVMYCNTRYDPKLG